VIVVVSSGAGRKGRKNNPSLLGSNALRAIRRKPDNKTASVPVIAKFETPEE